jgi:hypothetical protein
MFIRNLWGVSTARAINPPYCWRYRYKYVFDSVRRVYLMTSWGILDFQLWFWVLKITSTFCVFFFTLEHRWNRLGRGQQYGMPSLHFRLSSAMGRAKVIVFLAMMLVLNVASHMIQQMFYKTSTVALAIARASSLVCLRDVHCLYCVHIILEINLQLLYLYYFMEDNIFCNLNSH